MTSVETRSRQWSADGCHRPDTGRVESRVPQKVVNDRLGAGQPLQEPALALDNQLRLFD